MHFPQKNEVLPNTTNKQRNDSNDTDVICFAGRGGQIEIGFNSEFSELFSDSFERKENSKNKRRRLVQMLENESEQEVEVRFSMLNLRIKQYKDVVGIMMRMMMMMWILIISLQ
jgi:hypothetical protein